MEHLPKIDGKIVKIQDENHKIWYMISEPKYSYTDKHFMDDVVGRDENGEEIYDEFPADVYTATVAMPYNDILITSFIEIMVLKKTEKGNVPNYSNTLETSDIVYIHTEHLNEKGDSWNSMECATMIKENP